MASQRLTIEQIYRCPYCSRRGTARVVAADLAALFNAALGGPRISEEVDWSPAEPRRIFLFNSDGVPNCPCPHMVSLILNAWVNVLREDGESERPVSHSMSWDHSWFDVNDRGKLLEEFLWLEVCNGDTSAFYPETRFEIESVDDVQRRVSRADRELYVCGTVIVSVNAEQFLGELRSGYRAEREYYRRTGQE
jgi:hypothetical protein